MQSQNNIKDMESLKDIYQFYQNIEDGFFRNQGLDVCSRLEIFNNNETNPSKKRTLMYEMTVYKDRRTIDRNEFYLGEGGFPAFVVIYGADLDWIFRSICHAENCWGIPTEKVEKGENFVKAYFKQDNFIKD